jgi:hypothetical protein
MKWRTGTKRSAEWQEAESRTSEARECRQIEREEKSGENKETNVGHRVGGAADSQNNIE